MKVGYTRQEGDQIPTRPTTIPAIMARATFALGVSDARHGRPYHPDFDLWSGNDQWAYERGVTLQSLNAPDFSLPDLDGRMHSLAEHRGKKVFLVTWASW